MSKANILVIDIETAPIEAYVWGLFDQNIGLDFLKTDWSILSFAAKWLGRKGYIEGNTGGRGADKVRDDSALMPQIHALLDEADIVVAQNGKKFDCRKMNARLIAHGFGPPSPYRVVDTMLVARKYFAFTSQKLAYTSELLTGRKKDEHKEFPGIELWLECLKDNPRAWKVMARYNRRDILRTLDVYKKVRGWIENHPNLGVYDESERPVCPACGSKRVIKWQTRIVRKQQGAYQQYKCLNCGHHPRGKVMLLNLDKRRSLLAQP